MVFKIRNRLPTIRFHPVKDLIKFISLICWQNQSTDSVKLINTLYKKKKKNLIIMWASLKSHPQVDKLGK